MLGSALLACPAWSYDACSGADKRECASHFETVQSLAPADLEEADITAELIGAPVFAADGSQVGEVVDVSYDDEHRPERLRFKTASVLGLGERIVEIDDGSFITLRGAVRLDIDAEAVQLLPDLDMRDEE